MNINRYMCPTSNNFTLQGGYLPHYGYIYILVEIKMCIGTTSSGVPWRSEDEIRAAIDGASVQLIFVNSYFDFNDYEKLSKTT